MIKDYKHLIGLQHIHMEQMLCVKSMWKWNAFKERESEMLEIKFTIKYSIKTINIKNDQLW